jgi:hypothetical protein
LPTQFLIQISKQSRLGDRTAIPSREPDITFKENDKEIGTSIATSVYLLFHVLAAVEL